MTIYVSNLALTITNEDLDRLFSLYGKVSKAEVAIDGFTGSSRGFAYVTMDDAATGEKAMEQLHNSQLQGRTITAREAQPVTVHKGSYRVGTSGVLSIAAKK